MARDLLQDLRHGVRLLRRSPGFTVLVVLSLALGMASNTAIFSLIDAVLLRPLPVPQPDQLVLMTDGNTGGRWRWDEVTEPRLDLYTYPLYQRLRADPLFDGVVAEDSSYTPALVVESGSADGRADARATGRLVSANYFSALRVPAWRGRTFLPEDETAPGANPVLVLSHAYWQRRFGGSPEVVGAHLTVNGTAYTVVGVAPAGFSGTEIASGVDFWAPLTMQAALTRDRSLLGPPTGPRDLRWLLVVGRLKAGVSLAAAEASANRILQAFLDADPALAKVVLARQPIRIALDPGVMGFNRLGQSFREPLLTLMAGVGLLLLIVCLNLSHLLLARAIGRQREMGIRAALGASRARLVRQLLAEGLLLAALGAAAAALATRWLSDGLIALASVRNLEVGQSPRVVAFTALLALGTAVLIGMVPALQTSRRRGDLQLAMREGSRAIAGAGGRRVVSRLLLASQVAFSLVLLVGAGLMAGTLGKLRGVDKGFDEANVLLVDLNLRLTGLGKQQLVPLEDELLRRVAALPGVRFASLSQGARLPGGGRHIEPIFLPGSTAEVRTMIGSVTPAHFATLGLTLARGRVLTADDRKGAPPVAVINETLARQMGGGQRGDGESPDVVGKRFRFEDQEITVVGVIRNAKANGLRRAARPMIYVPAAQATQVLDDLEVRTDGTDPAAVTEQIRRVLREAHPALAGVAVRSLRSQVERSLGRERLLATLSSAFGLAALFLVCLGLYGVISQWASHRTREIGVRMALGATSGGVRWLVLRQGFVLVLAGVLVGLPAAMAAARLLADLLFGVSPTDAKTMAAAALALFAVATAAAYLPARRASRVDPMKALRAE
jgi:predicted permease